MTKAKEMTGWDKAQLAMTNGLDRLLLYGAPGTGKTYFGLHYHLSSNQKAYRLICTDEMTDGDLVGHFIDTGSDGHAWVEGMAIKAWREGARLVVDEINRVNGDVESRLMAIIDTVASSSWQHPTTGEIVTPQPGFSVIATMNGEPADLSPAIRDRLVARVEIDTPHPDAISALPEYLREIAKQFASTTVSDERYSLRSFFQYAGLIERGVSPMDAAHLLMPNIAEGLADATAVLQAEGN